MEVGQSEIEAFGIVILQRAEIAQVTPDADVVVDVAEYTAADVDPEVASRQVVEERAAVDPAPDQADAAGPTPGPR